MYVGAVVQSCETLKRLEDEALKQKSVEAGNRPWMCEGAPRLREQEKGGGW